MLDGQLVEFADGVPGIADLLNQAIGSELRLVREEGGWSREQLATRSPFNRHEIASIEEGESSFTIRQYYYLCEALGTHPLDLFTKSLQRRRIWLKKNLVQVALTKIQDDKTSAYTWLHIWTSSQQASYSDWVELNQTEVMELAEANGCEWRDLLTHLITFIPDERMSFERYLEERKERLTSERHREMNEYSTVRDN